MTRYAVANGNYLDGSTWDGGTVPGPTAVVRPNGFTVNINGDITAAELRNDASGPAAVGGTFTPTVSCTITANIPGHDITGSTTFVVLTHQNGIDVTIAGSIRGGRRATAVLMRAAARNLTVTGNADITTTTTAVGNAIAFESTFNGGRIEIGGNLIGGPVTGSQALFINLIESGPSYNPALTYVPVEVIVKGDCVSGLASSGTALSADKSLVHLTVWGDIRVNGTVAVLFSSNGDAPAGSTILVYGNCNMPFDKAGAAISIATVHANTIDVHGSVSGGLGRAIVLQTSSSTLRVRGSATGGKVDLAYAIRNDALSTVDVRGDAIGGVHSGAHAIRNQSTGTVRVGGQDVTNPSGALGVSNPGGGTVTTEYLAEMDPAYFPDVKAAEGGKVLVTLLKNSVNASTLVTGTPTVEVFDFARASVFGEPKAMTLTDEVFSYQHPTNVMTPRRLYYARVAAVIDGEARDLIERPFVAQ